MLQYVLEENRKYTVGELAQMAVEGGCRWITLSLNSLSDIEVREAVDPDVIDLCKEADVFLTIDDRPELARELGMHGVRLSSKYFLDHPESTPTSLREELGPEAVIGVEGTDISSIPMLMAADVDFVTLAADEKKIGEWARAVKDSGSVLPIVAQGNLTPVEAAAAIAAGASGVAIGGKISDSPDPEQDMRDYLELLTSL